MKCPVCLSELHEQEDDVYLLCLDEDCIACEVLILDEKGNPMVE